MNESDQELTTTVAMARQVMELGEEVGRHRKRIGKLAAQLGDSRRIEGQRTVECVSLTAESDKLRSERDKLSRTVDNLIVENKRLAAENVAERSPQDEKSIRHLDNIIDQIRDILGNPERLVDEVKRLVAERDRAMEERNQIAGDLDEAKYYGDMNKKAAKYYGAVFKKAHDILGWDNPRESLEDAAERIVDKLAALENLSPQSECERLRGVISVVHDILGRVSTNLVNAIAADAQRVVGERDEWESSAKRFRQERDSLASELYEVRDVARDVWKVYGRVVKCGDEDGRIARHNDLDDAMGALDEVLNRGMDDQEGPDATDDGDMVAVDFVQCQALTGSTMRGAEQCVEPEGHDGSHVFPSEVGEPGEVIDAEWVRCPEMDGDLQCVYEVGHDRVCGFGESLDDEEPGEAVKEFVQCPYTFINDQQCIEESGHGGRHTPGHGLVSQAVDHRCKHVWVEDDVHRRCVLPLDHIEDHRFED